MKTSNIRHNLFSKTDHDKVFIEKNYQAAIERNQVVKEELPPIRLDVRKRIAKEQLALKLSRKTTVITHATSMSNDQQGSNSTRSITGLLDSRDEGGMLKLSDAGIDDYDDEHASVISNESEELEKLKSSPDINKEEDLLNELGYIGHISEEEEDDDDDDEGGDDEDGSDDGSSTVGFSVQGGASMKPKNHYSSTLEVHKEFIGHANRRDTLRQIKSVGSVRALVAREQSQRAQSEDIIIPSSSKRSSSIPDNSSSKTKHHTSDHRMSSSSPTIDYSLKNTFMFISKLTEEGLPHLNQLLMSGIDNALNRDTSTTAQQQQQQEESLAHSSPDSNADRSSRSNSSNSIEGYNASPIGIKYKGSGRSTFAFTSDTIASAKRDTQLVSPLLSASTVTSLMNSASTRGSILNSHKSSSPSTIVRIAPTTTVHLDSITDFGNSSGSSGSHKESKFYVPALQSIHNQDKPVLQKLDKIFHRMTFQAADPKPDLVITPKPPLTLETLFPDQIMRKGDNNDANDDCEEDDDEMEAYLQRSLASSPTTNKGNANHRVTGTAALIDRLDRVLDQHGDLAVVTRNNNYGTSNATSTSPCPSKFKAVKDDDNDRQFYKIDVHRLQLPDINTPMVCLYTPSSPQVQTRGSSSFFKGDIPKEKVESSHILSTAVVGATPSSAAFDSPLLYSKHSNSFYKTSGGSPVDATTAGGTGGGGLTKDKISHHSSSALSLPLEGILDHSYKQGLSEDTLAYVASMQIAQASHGDAAFHTLPVVSDLDMMFSIDDIPTDTDTYSSSFSIPHPLHTSLPRTHQMKARSVTHETSDSGIYDIDMEEHRKLMPSTVADLSGEGYIYQHSTNSYVRRDVENRSKFGQYQRGEYTHPPSIQQQNPMEFNAPWSEHMDVKGELPVQIFSERHLEEIEQSTAGFGSPVIYIPKEPPAFEPLLPLNSDPISSSSSNSPMKGSIASISTLGPPPYSLATATNQHGITQIPGGTALGSSSYAPVRAVMQYPIDSPLNYVHYHPTTTTAATTYGRTANDNGSVADTDRSSTYSPVDVRSPTRLKEVPSSKAVSSLKSEINDYMNRLDASSSFSSTAASYRSMSTSITGLGVGGDDEVSESDLAKAKLWSRLNSRYSGDRDGEHTAKLKVKQYIYEGIKETTHIENQYTKDMDAWF